MDLLDGFIDLHWLTCRIRIFIRHMIYCNIWAFY